VIRGNDSVLTYEDIRAFVDITAALDKAEPARPVPPAPRRESAADARQPARPAPEAAAAAKPKPRRPLDLAA
jgi:hypothetical protein